LAVGGWRIVIRLPETLNPQLFHFSANRQLPTANQKENGE
jgi:hypothetical protein